ncbi:MAG: hypothetical protein II812_02755, partial [Prevotella sp.]|nr:hypothetical protein [Prevotella sp.]
EEAGGHLATGILGLIINTLSFRWAVVGLAPTLPHLNTFNAQWCKIFDSQRFVSRIITLKYIDKDNNEDLEKHSWSLAEPPQYAIAKGGEYLVDADGRQTSSCSA